MASSPTSFPLGAIPSSPALLWDDNKPSAAAAATDLATVAAAGASDRVLVHPLVLFHILDHHSRRQETSGRVIGSLLGRRDGRTVEITNAFAVPHAERGDEVAIGKDFNKKMLTLYQRSSRTKEVIVGWYASAGQDCDLVADTSSLIHEFYAGETDEGDPVHVTVDTRLIDNLVKMNAYKSSPVIIMGEHVGNAFHEIELKLLANEPETICLHEMIATTGGADGTTTSSKATLQMSMEKLYELLVTTLEYVNQVVGGKIPADSEKGRLISDALESVPRVRPEIFDRLFHESLQDLLMVEYLSNITRTQLTIAEKLNASLGTV
jgi:translation initiation factor 3 subunit F